MTAADHRCEVCGYDNFYAGVASCSMPMSIAWCTWCLAMGAQPQVVFEVLGIDPKLEEAPYAHFDKELDMYFLGKEHLPLEHIDGRSWNKRGEVREEDFTGQMKQEPT